MILPDNAKNIGKLIPLDKAAWFLRKKCQESQLNDTETQVLIDWLYRVETVNDGETGYAKLETVKDILRNFRQYLVSGDPSALVEQRGFKTNKLVDVIEFAESREFLGNTYKPWESVKENLWMIWHGPEIGKYYPDGTRKTEIVLTGAIRTGKSFTVQGSYLYTLYLLSQMWNPYAEFGLSPGRAIALIVQSIKKEKAQEILLDPMRADLDASPYFLEHFPRNTKINSKCLMPNNIVVAPLTGEDTSALGANVYQAAFTESNFMAVTKNSVKLRYSNKSEYDQARELFNKAAERMHGTFDVENPLFFGKLYTDSSVEHPGDFTHSKIEQAKTDPTILVINRTIWDAQPESKWPRNAPTFLVEVGDTHRPSRIIADRSEAFDPENSVIPVPEKLRQFFIADIESALKNYAARVTTVSGAFFPKEWVTRCQDQYVAEFGDERLFKFDEISFIELFGRRKPGEPVDWDLLINWDYLEKVMIDTEQPLCMRVDLSATQDATGFSIMGYHGTKEVPTATVYNPKTGRYEQSENEILPVYVCHGVLRIVARHGEEIDVELVTELGLILNQRLSIKWGLTDTAESSRAIRQAWRRAGIIVGAPSVDSDIHPWIETKSAMREERFLFPPNSVVDREFKEARKKVKNGKTKIDHPDTSTGSKDCIDTMVGNLFVLKMKAHACLMIPDSRKSSTVVDLARNRATERRTSTSASLQSWQKHGTGGRPQRHRGQIAGRIRVSK